MKLKYLFSKKDVINRIKGAINHYGPENPYLKTSYFQALRGAIKEKSFSSFYYFLFKKIILNKTIDENKLDDILEKDLDKVFVNFILSKYKKTKINNKNQILNLSYRTFLKRINQRLPEGERYYIHYKNINNPLKNKNGEVVLIQKGGPRGLVLYQKIKESSLHPNGKIIFPGDTVQYELFPV